MYGCGSGGNGFDALSMPNVLYENGAASMLDRTRWKLSGTYAWEYDVVAAECEFEGEPKGPEDDPAADPCHVSLFGAVGEVCWR